MSGNSFVQFGGCDGNKKWVVRWRAAGEKKAAHLQLLSEVTDSSSVFNLITFPVSTEFIISLPKRCFCFPLQQQFLRQRLAGQLKYWLNTCLTTTESPLFQLFGRMLKLRLAVKLRKCFVDYGTSPNFPSAWGWVDNDWTLILGWTFLLKLLKLFQESGSDSKHLPLSGNAIKTFPP